MTNTLDKQKDIRYNIGIKRKEIEMDKKLKNKILNAKSALIDLTIFNDFKVNSKFVQQRVIFAIETLDDILDGKIMFEDTSLDK